MSTGVCPRCKAATSVGAAFCMSCGAKLDASAPQPRGLSAPRVVLLVISIVAVLVVGVGLITAAGIALFLRQPPGPASTFVYEADAGATAAEMKAARAVIERRLALAGARRASVRVDGRRLRVSFAVEDPADVDSFLRARGLLELVPVAKDPSPDDRNFESSSRADLEATAASLTAPHGTPAYEETDEGRWRLWFLDRTELLSAPAIEYAWPFQDKDSGGWGIHLQLSRKDGEAFEALSAKHLKEHLAIVLDGEVLMAPLVREPVPGGKLAITLGRRDSIDDQKRSAERLCRLLRAEALPVELHLASQGD